jgi:hypothetical protein
METTIPSHFILKFNPSANPEAVVEAGQARFTVLTPRMIRMEWSPNNIFEERASQAFWFRDQPVPKFDVKRAKNRLVIDTGALQLVYVPGQPFSAETLSIELKLSGGAWRHGDSDPGNLLGTARTVDGVDGAAPLSLGLVSRSGWSVVDDSNSLVFNEIGWLEPRSAPAGQMDLYFFGYGHDYFGCLREFNLVSGRVPMIPRFVLGNWWSRYWEYSQEELTDLMLDFEKREVPLSVCIIDMDWHITQTGNLCSGWTGYTWNRQLFPDPEEVLRFLHSKGLKAALNLHPAEGVHPHEEAYPAICAALGMDPVKQEPVEFDITNPRFVNAYFTILHHPQEERGIDFWWMDWQQGARTRLSGLDPLWWLNHLHFLDLGRDGKRRSFIFSRWGGLGNHRYPIGFSGDSVITWASLAFQPYFTATSSNVNYGWWSHDIGGHMGGISDAELYARWVQLGVFLPILRLHSTKNAFLERRPWGYDAETFEVARAALQLRHALIPYLYSMAWRFHRENIPPLLPMYYEYPELEEAYACPNQYLFGSQLVAAPFISPVDPDTRLSRSTAWLPAGDWYDYFTGQYYPGDGWHAVYGTLRDIPVFARAGAIVPRGPAVGWGGIDTPDHLLIHVFPGADGSFDLYEDEGNTNAYLDGAYAVTPFRQAWAGSSTVLTIGPAEGQVDLLPGRRQVDLYFRGFTQPKAVEARLNGAPVQVEMVYDAVSRTLLLAGLALSPTDRLEVRLAGGELADRSDARQETLLRMLTHFRLENGAKEELARQLPELVRDPSGLGRYLPVLRDAHLRALLEVASGAGMDCTTSTGDSLLVVWNNRADEKVTHNSVLNRVHHWWRFKERRPWTSGVLPRFQAIRPKQDFGEEDPWLVTINYYGIYTEKAGKQ